MHTQDVRPQYNGSALYVHRADHPFVMVPRSALRCNLRWDEMGLYTWLMSHDPSFKITEAYIISCGNAGREAVRRMLHSLEHAGYLARSRARDDYGRLGDGQWHLYWQPVNEQTSTDDV